MHGSSGLITWSTLPAWVAILNGISAVFLILGYIFIRQRRILAHKRAMLTAFGSSILFLIVYIVHHVQAGVVYFKGHGWHRVLYLTVLGTHTPLATAVPVLAIVTLRYGLKGKFGSHRRWAKWTWPIWMYVSVTGVVVYWMLYHWS